MGCTFTGLVTQAIHLDDEPDLLSETFVWCLKRITAYPVLYMYLAVGFVVTLIYPSACVSPSLLLMYVVRILGCYSWHSTWPCESDKKAHKMPTI